jgi:TolB-like protein
MENPVEGLSEPASPQTAEQALKQKKKKDKVRSAWISFVGRIVAQILGAVATITLGLALADRLRADLNDTADAAVAPAVQVQDHGMSVAVLPIELFSEAGQQHLADRLTEGLISNLMTVPGLKVVSRTSSMQARQHPRSVPEIARALGVSMVIEGCLIRDGDGMRLTARVIDATHDINLGTDITRTVSARDLLTGADEVAASMARELADIMRAAHRPR